MIRKRGWIWVVVVGGLWVLSDGLCFGAGRELIVRLWEQDDVKAFGDAGKPVLAGLERLQKVGFQEVYHPQGVGVLTLGEGRAAVYVGHVEEGLDVYDVMEALREQPEVLYVQPNYQYFLVEVSQSIESDRWPLDMLGFPAMQQWIQRQGSSLVAVIDTGVDRDHPALEEGMWENVDEIPANEIDDDDNGFMDDRYGWDTLVMSSDIDDENGHGTHVAGIIAAGSNTYDEMEGVGKGCKVLPLKAANERGMFTSLSVALAIDYAVMMGADVINLSLGAPRDKVPEEFLLRDAIEAALQQGSWVVAAAGNQGLDIKKQAYVPAMYPGVIAVAAVTREGVLAERYSNYGSDIRVKAPGGNIAYGIRSTLPRKKIRSGYGIMAGTSMAAPFVAGILGMMHSYFPDLSKQAIEASMYASGQEQPEPIDKMVPYLPSIMQDLVSKSSRHHSETPEYMPPADEIIVSVAVTDEYLPDLMLDVDCKYRWVFSSGEDASVGGWTAVPARVDGRRYVVSLRPNAMATGIDYLFKSNSNAMGFIRFPESQWFRISFVDNKAPKIVFQDQIYQTKMQRGKVSFNVHDSNLINWESLRVQLFQYDLPIEYEFDQESPEITIHKQHNRLDCDLTAVIFNRKKALTIAIHVEDVGGNRASVYHVMPSLYPLQLLQQDTQEPGIRVGPNPFTGTTLFVEYELTQAADMDIIITTINGDVVLRRQYSKYDAHSGTPGAHQLKLDLSHAALNMPNGPYIVTLIARQNNVAVMEHQKVVVIRS